mmetsp:Transcript_117614/g.344384  ORF Transcript_117614/g.344384 Transcript_117614/m.344384 type:complete len:236 (+) Transcript_117614:918-1625(+)
MSVPQKPQLAREQMPVRGSQDPQWCMQCTVAKSRHRRHHRGHRRNPHVQPVRRTGLRSVAVPPGIQSPGWRLQMQHRPPRPSLWHHSQTLEGWRRLPSAALQGLSMLCASWSLHAARNPRQAPVGSGQASAQATGFPEESASHFASHPCMRSPLASADSTAGRGQPRVGKALGVRLRPAHKGRRLLQQLRSRAQSCHQGYYWPRQETHQGTESSLAWPAARGIRPHGDAVLRLHG